MSNNDKIWDLSKPQLCKLNLITANFNFFGVSQRFTDNVYKD